MKKILSVIVVLAAAYYSYQQASVSGPQIPETDRDALELEEAIRSRLVDYQVRGGGMVVRVLSDDTNGSRHQRFIVRLTSGQTLLIAHNIDLAPRVKDLRPGQRVAFFGEYAWNEQGGVIHWTHHDPAGQHVAGWLEYHGRRYQ